MHIILGILGTIVTILVLLNRLAEAGIDLGGLNPFLWARRRKWKKQYQGNPVFNVDDPMELTALLMVAVAKIDGDVSSEEKHRILELFQQEFKMSKREASGLMVSSVYLLKDGSEISAQLAKVMEPAKEKFSTEQAESAIKMLNTVAEIEGKTSDLKTELINAVQAGMAVKFQEKTTWSGQ